MTIRIVNITDENKEPETIDATRMGGVFTEMHIGHWISIKPTSTNSRTRFLKIVDIHHIFEEYVTRLGEPQEIVEQKETIYFVKEET